MPKSGAMTNARQQDPFRNVEGPSFLQIFLAQSTIPLYASSFAPLCSDWNRVLITSHGLTATAAMEPAMHPDKNEWTIEARPSTEFCPSLFRLANNGK